MSNIVKLSLGFPQASRGVPRYAADCTSLAVGDNRQSRVMRGDIIMETASWHFSFEVDVVAPAPWSFIELICWNSNPSIVVGASLDQSHPL